MRYLIVPIIAVALLAAGYLAADLRSPDAGAQGTWHTEYFTPASAENRPVFSARTFIESLPADCTVDFEIYGNGPYAVVAYSCPD